MARTIDPISFMSGDGFNTTSIREPRSRRVSNARQPSLQRSTSTIDSSLPPTPTLTPPTIPARSARRPPARQVLSAPKVPHTDKDIAIADPMPILRGNRSFVSLSGLLDSFKDSNSHEFSPELIKARPVPIFSDSPSLSPVDVDEPASSSSSLINAPSAAASSVSKRTHALLELLSSERAYASDLALIRDVHIPLALGQPGPFQQAPITPPSSGSSSRTLSSSSEGSNHGPISPAMTLKDTKIIFSNIPDLAVFSDMFTDRLERALGNVIEEGQREDHVGELFLEITHMLEPPYNTYITRHSQATAHLNALPKTPALMAYLAHTQTLASSLTHAWDLASLLIKPVQRLLKYSLLLGAIIDETPDSHPDKENLKLAKKKMEEVAANVNEGKRRWEIVKEVLNSKPKVMESPKRKASHLAVAAQANLQRMRNTRSVKAREENEEAIQIEMMELELRRADAFVQEFARASVEWSKTVGQMISNLRNWAIGFARLLGLSEDENSEAFDAFLVVLEQQLMPLCQRLDEVVKGKLLVDLARLIDTCHSPIRLLEAMDTLEPLHYSLLNINVSKTRPAPSLLEASKSYIAVRGQLSLELPKYLQLLQKGITSCVLLLTKLQTEFWEDIRDRWGELWDALRVDGEMNAGAEETTRVWWDRWADVEKVVLELNIINQKSLYVDPIPPPMTPPSSSGRFVVPSSPAAQRSGMLSILSAPPERPVSPISASVTNMLFALEPSSPGAAPPSPTYWSPQPSYEYPHADRSTTIRSPTIRTAMSTDSLRSKKTLKKDKKAEKKAPKGKSSKKEKSKKKPAESDEFFEMWYTAPVLPKSGLRREQSVSKDRRSSTSSTRKFERGDSQESLGLYAESRQKLEWTPDSFSGKELSRSPQTKVHEFPPERGRSPRRSSGPSPSHLPATLPPLPTPHCRSSSIESLQRAMTSAFKLDSSPPNMPTFHSLPPQTPPAQPLLSRWHHASAKYSCRVVHPCSPPDGVSYHDLPFFSLHLNHVFEVLEEAGHPSFHTNLPLYVDDGEDCLLLVRSITGDVGWALASFLVPLG